MTPEQKMKFKLLKEKVQQQKLTQTVISYMEYPKCVSKKDLVGKLVFNDQDKVGGQIITARKIGISKMNKDKNSWRITAKITDPKYVAVLKMIKPKRGMSMSWK